MRHACTLEQGRVGVASRGAPAEHGRLGGLVVTAAPPAQTLDPACRHDLDAVLEAVDIKGMGFLRVANAALPIMTAAGYGRIVAIACVA